MGSNDDKQITIGDLPVPAPDWTKVKDGEIVVDNLPVNFLKPYLQPPTLVPVFRKFDVGNDHQRTWRIYTELEVVGNSSASFGVGTWADSKLYAATLQWLSIPASNHSFQTGTVTIPQGGSNGRVHFPKPFNSQPQMFYTFNRIDLSHEFRIDLNVHTITSNGFNFEVESWSNGLVDGAVVTWIAFTGNMAGVGLYTVQFQTGIGDPNEGTIVFDKAINNPQVFIGLNKMDIVSVRQAVRIEVQVSSLNSTSMHWKVVSNGEDVVLQEARVTFLVIGTLSN
ncbi:hypothetical protein EYR38_008744 [Pleurotus pulmonarius]|nr:hypothetical protein EYR38_008744 [Pleurotus pulmonarius]